MFAKHQSGLVIMGILLALTQEVLDTS